MIATLSMLAADGDLDFFNSTAGLGKGSGLVIKDILLILAVVLVLAAALVVWAKYLRGSGGSHHHHRRKHRPSSEADTTAAADPEPVVESPAAETAGSDQDDTGDTGGQHRHHRQKIHRREHRPRNPTLSETGGLPPVRDEKTPPLVP